MPTHADILRETAAIQRTWDETKRRQRLGLTDTPSDRHVAKVTSYLNGRIVRLSIGDL